jgi:hypothetical protein
MLYRLWLTKEPSSSEKWAVALDYAREWGLAREVISDGLGSSGHKEGDLEEYIWVGPGDTEERRNMAMHFFVAALRGLVLVSFLGDREALRQEK